MSRESDISKPGLWRWALGGFVFGFVLVLFVTFSLRFAHRAYGGLPATPAVVQPKPTLRECMALAAFGEARSEGVVGMAAVLEVIRNRGVIPLDACSVVYRPHQFAIGGWTAGRAERADADAWGSALVLSSLALSGAALVPHKCRGATYFNQARSTRGLIPLCRIGAHQFYKERT